MPISGLYESLITDLLASELQSLKTLHPEAETLRSAEAADRLSVHLARVVQRVVSAFPEKDRVERGVAIARQVVEHLLDDNAVEELPTENVLHGIFTLNPDGTPARVPRPLTPLLDTTLHTNARGEPALMHEVKGEIASADRIDVLMAFVRVTGISPIREELRRHCQDDKPLRVLTTTYTGSTEAKALNQLQDLGADVRVSYDTSSTRLHAKAWHFHRNTGFSTAYIGSSNLTHSAQVDGLEWNVRVSGARNPTVLEKIDAVFETYWHGGDFVPYDPKEFAERTRVSPGPSLVLSPVEVRPFPFQERLLEELALAREQGHHRNLLVAATGTGKTVMAAVDYRRLRHTLPRARLLFVAHREEILQQSLATFRHALRDGEFGELWVGGKRPQDFEHVFASIQSLSAQGYESLDPAHFDVVIVDEFHHAAAHSYTRLLEHVNPRELLGLTATPERADGLDILQWFDGRIAAELRLWDAIDQQRLSPFIYYGVHDELDLTEIPWKRGRGYDVDALTNLLTANDLWAGKVIQALEERVANVNEIRTLGFCVSVQHAQFMARVFNQAGIRSTAVWGNTPNDERKAALAKLASGETKVVFSVDLFNEGIDVPRVDTLLLLRPTDSATLFLQQLGRGLRRHEGKGACLVLDFVGQHRREFRFDRKLRALLGGSRKEIERQVEQGFPFLPAGCHMQLDRVAREIVLENIRRSLPNSFKQQVEELRHQGDVSLKTFVEESGLELEDVYSGSGRSWSQLRAAAGFSVQPEGEHEAPFRRALGRLLHVDDPERLGAWRDALQRSSPPPFSALPRKQQQALRMLVASLFYKLGSKEQTVESALARLWDHPQVRWELLELLGALEVRRKHVGHVPSSLGGLPLRVHARYTRVEIRSGVESSPYARVGNWQGGFYFSEEVQADILTFTLDKTSGNFSPTTRYRDYAISPKLLHWESQSVTRAESKVGQRYQKHREMGTHILPFARLNTSERAFYFLGPARYVSHQGERPMQIVWELEHELPGDLYAEFAAAVG